MNYRKKLHASLTVVTGPMFAGKSTYLIDLWNQMPGFRKGQTLVAKHAADTRYSCDEPRSTICSHELSRIPCQLVSSVVDLSRLIEDTEPRIVLIDEAQFFQQDLVPLVAKLTSELGIQVYCFGLDLTAEGEPFGPMPQLMAIAEEVEKLKASCTVCGNAAIRTHRLGEISGVDVGGADKYEARCLTHWKE